MPGTNKKIVLAVMCLCVTLVIATVAAINISIPKIEAGKLHPSGAQLLWIVDLYVVVFAGLLFPSGAIGDRYGRKTGLLCGLAVYSAGSILAALAPNITVFFAARVIMGMGAAFIMPITLAVITFVFSGKERQGAISTWSACAAVGGGIGLLAGGAISQLLNWNAIFLLGAFVGIIALIFAAIYTPKTPPSERPIDLPGSALLVTCFVSLLFGIIEAPELGWLSWPDLGAFAISAGAMTAFIFSGLKRKDALFDPRVFKKPELRSGALGVSVSFFAMFSLYFVNAQFLQYAKGYGPLLTGLAILPATATIFTFSKLSPWFTEKFGTRTVITSGMGCMAIGLLCLSFCGITTPYLWYALSLVLVAVGPGVSNPSFSDAIMNSFDPEKAGLGSAINDTTREVGSAIGVAVMGTFIAAIFPKKIPQPVLKLVGEKMAKGSVGDVIEKVQKVKLAPLAPNMEALKQAFTDAIHTGFRFSSLVVLIVAIVLYRWYPEKAK